MEDALSEIEGGRPTPKPPAIVFYFISLLVTPSPVGESYASYESYVCANVNGFFKKTFDRQIYGRNISL